jgi:beta-glucosidase
MNGRTYRYFKGQPLYGFGYGLSYTIFRYDKLGVTQAANKSAKVSVRVTNAGKMAGEEVVQLYISGQDENSPVTSLKGFQRITLKPGESKTVYFNLPAEDFGIADDQGNPKPFRGQVLISVGGQQPTAEAIKLKNVVTHMR